MNTSFSSFVFYSFVSIQTPFNYLFPGVELLIFFLCLSFLLLKPYIFPSHRSYFISFTCASSRYLTHLLFLLTSNAFTHISPPRIPSCSIVSLPHLYLFPAPNAPCPIAFPISSVHSVTNRFPSVSLIRFPRLSPTFNFTGYTFNFNFRSPLFILYNLFSFFPSFVQNLYFCCPHLACPS